MSKDGSTITMQVPGKGVYTATQSEDAYIIITANNSGLKSSIVSLPIEILATINHHFITLPMKMLDLTEARDIINEELETSENSSMELETPENPSIELESPEKASIETERSTTGLNDTETDIDLSSSDLELLTGL